MTWTGPGLVLQSLEPKSASANEITNGVVLKAKGSGFDDGVAVVLVPHGTEVSEDAFTNMAIESQDMDVVSENKLEFKVKEAQAPDTGKYDAVIVQPVVEDGTDPSVAFAVLSEAFEVT